MKNYLVTGGAGFIGSHLIKSLIKRKCKIFVIDLKDQISKNYILNSKIEYINGNIANKKTFNQLNTIKFETAYHLAAQTSARVSMESPELDIRTNINGSFNFCEWASENKPRKALFTSSMAVYGSSSSSINENNFTNPVSIYGITKLAAEGFFKILRSKKNNVKIVRLFNAYGPGQDFLNMKQGMLSIFLYQAFKNKRIKITGDLNRYRDFIFIDDIVNSINCVLTSKYDLVNIGSGKKTTIKELIKIISKVMNCKLTVEEIEGHQGDVFGTYSKNSLLNSIYNKSFIGLENGIKLTYNSLLKSKL